MQEEQRAVVPRAVVRVVERAFASVRLVEANVCVGGGWLLEPTVKVIDGDSATYIEVIMRNVIVCVYSTILQSDVQVCRCEVMEHAQGGCGDGCMNRAVGSLVFVIAA